MNKKCILLMLFVVLQAIEGIVGAQQLSAEMQAAYNACLKMRSAIGAGSQTGLKAASKAFKMCNTKNFGVLRCLSKNPLPLDGHFVFDDVFVDSLIAGRDVYQFAQRYAKSRSVRGASSSGVIFDKTCAVRKSSSVKYLLVSKGRQELAFVTEPGGMITIRIYDKTNDRWYNDTKDVKKGQLSRYHVFDLPTDRRCTLEIEIINTVDKDISFVILGN